MRKDLVVLGSILKKNLYCVSPTREQYLRSKYPRKQKEFNPKEGSPITAKKPARNKNSITCFKC